MRVTRYQVSKDPQYSRIKDLLAHSTMDLHGVALKHLYASAVVNSFDHRVGIVKDEREPGTFHVAGFGDAERTLPVHLIARRNPGRAKLAITHAMVPKPNQHYGSLMLRALQNEENAFAERYDIKPRDLKREVEDRGIDNALAWGIDRGETALVIDNTYLARARAGIDQARWLNTNYLLPDLDMTGESSISVHDERIRDNMADSVEHNTVLAVQDMRFNGDRPGSVIMEHMDVSRSRYKPPLKHHEDDDFEYE